MPYLKVSKLQVRYGGQTRSAVDQVSFGLRAGEIGALIGPSGCGKTTLLRAVAGLEAMAAGTVHLAGALVEGAGVHVPVEKRRVGMVFQDYALFPHLDVGNNVCFGIQGLPIRDRMARVAEVLALVGLADSERLYPHQLSGGQQQRVALARALAPRPQLMLLDEPFSSLDVDLRERLAHEVRDILKTAGTTALLVTHDQMEAFAIADSIGVMREGQLHQWADAYTIYHQPSTRFVADFIGNGTFAPARLERSAEGRVTAHTVLGPMEDVQVRVLPTGQAHGEFDMLWRADDVVYDTDAPAKAQIVRKVFRGANFLYTLQLPTGQRLVAQVPSHCNHETGEWIGIRAAMSHMVLFERGST